MPPNIKKSKFNDQIPLDELKLNQKSYYYLQNWAFCSLKILNSGIILKTFAHVGLNFTQIAFKWENDIFLSETRVVLAQCLMSLNGHLLRPIGISTPCFSFTRFIVEQCLLQETSIWPLLTVGKLPGHHIVLNIVDTRHTVMPWRIPVSPQLFHIGIVSLLLWQMPRPQRSLGHS